MEYIKDLETKVNDMDKSLQTKYECGKKDAAKELEKEFEHKTIIAQKDYENVTNRLNDKIDSLTQELAKSNTLNITLQEKLDNAYVEIKELATKTVESTSKVRFINSNTNEDK